MALIRWIVLMMAIFGLTACASVLTKDELASIKTIKIVDQFPAFPNFTNVGTTVFNNGYTEVPSRVYKDYLISEIEKELSARGYTVVKSSTDKADLDLEVRPGAIYNFPYTSGYGFYDRSMFGKSLTVTSYVAMHVVPIKNGESRCQACYAESMTALQIDDMPDDWDGLDDKQKQSFEKSLLGDIKGALDKVLPKTGL